MWSTFYALTGASAATLTGLMFVVVTLVGRRRRRSQATTDGVSTFSTPTVVHFGSALLVSIIMCAPWPSIAGAATLISIFGLGGLAHMLWVLNHAKRLTEYEPDVEDWAWYTIVPIVAYATVFAGGIAVFASSTGMFVVAAAVALLIFMGIRNSWDVVTYIAISDYTEPPDTD